MKNLYQDIREMKINWPVLLFLPVLGPLYTLIEYDNQVFASTARYLFVWSWVFVQAAVCAVVIVAVGISGLSWLFSMTY